MINIKRLFLLIFLLFCACCLAQPVPSPQVIEKPEWRIGDSWEVDVPILNCPIGDTRGNGKYNRYIFSVVRLEEICKVNCYVLKVTQQQNLNVGSFVYYRVSDLALMGVKSFGGLEPGWEYRSIDGDSLINKTLGLSIPLDLPKFPLEVGKQIECKHKCPYPVLNYKNCTSILVSIDVDDVSPQDSERFGLDAVKLTFKEVDIFSDAEPYTCLYLDQVWTPGNKWWSSAKGYRLALGRCLLVRKPATKQKDNPKLEQKQQ